MYRRHPDWFYACILATSKDSKLSSKKEVPPGSEDPRGTTLLADEVGHHLIDQRKGSNSTSSSSSSFMKLTNMSLPLTAPKISTANTTMPQFTSPLANPRNPKTILLVGVNTNRANTKNNLLFLMTSNMIPSKESVSSLTYWMRLLR